MTILCDRDLNTMLADGLIIEPRSRLPAWNPDHVNPASIDICVGRNVMREVAHGRMESVTLGDDGLRVEPGDFLLVETAEHFVVPNGYAMDLRLKSSTARRGFDHSLAFWVDPGWNGVLTMEIRNVLQFNSLTLIPGQRFAQAIVHRLSGLSERPYQGRYNNAVSVEEAKD